MLYIINYGFGVARLYTPHEDWSARFFTLADQCFGIRKSIKCAQLIDSRMEEPENPLPDEYERLEHDGDVIVWNADGEKIKSEWDD